MLCFSELSLFWSCSSAVWSEEHEDRWGNLFQCAGFLAARRLQKCPTLSTELRQLQGRQSRGDGRMKSHLFNFWHSLCFLQLLIIVLPMKNWSWESWIVFVWKLNSKWFVELYNVIRRWKRCWRNKAKALTCQSWTGWGRLLTKTKAGPLIRSPPWRERGRETKTVVLNVMAGLQIQVVRKRERERERRIMMMKTVVDFQRQREREREGKRENVRSSH